MDKKYNFLVLICFLISFSICSQNTVGTILNSTASYNAYTLFTVKKETYLINNCGQVINQWFSDYNSGKSVYLLENGNLKNHIKRLESKLKKLKDKNKEMKRVIYIMADVD